MRAAWDFFGCTDDIAPEETAEEEPEPAAEPIVPIGRVPAAIFDITASVFAENEIPDGEMPDDTAPDETDAGFAEEAAAKLTGFGSAEADTRSLTRITCGPAVFGFAEISEEKEDDDEDIPGTAEEGFAAEENAEEEDIDDETEEAAEVEGETADETGEADDAAGEDDAADDAALPGACTFFIVSSTSAVCHPAPTSAALMASAETPALSCEFMYSTS